MELEGFVRMESLFESVKNKLYQHPKPSALCLVFALVIILTPCFATKGASREILQPNPGIKLNYDVFSKEKVIGSTTQIRQSSINNNLPVLRITSQTHLKVKSLFFTVFSLDSADTNLVGAQGLLEHHSTATIDGEKIIIHGKRQTNTFSFQLIEEDQNHRWSISLQDFDCSSIESRPLEKLQPNQSVTLKILQLETLEIETIQFKRLEDEVLDINNESLVCRVVNWAGANSSGQRWYSLNEPGIIVREDGEDQDGPYRFLLKQFPLIQKPVSSDEGTAHVR